MTSGTVRAATCATCRFWRADYILDEAPSEVGTCRLNPPQLVVVADERYALWPETDRDEWCGQHQEDTTYVAGPNFDAALKSVSPAGPDGEGNR